MMMAAACGGGYRGTGPSKPGDGPRTDAPIDLTAAALPSHVVDARTGRELDDASAWTTLAAARAVCVGEEHPNPHSHWVQLEVVKELAARAKARAAGFAVGMEMVQRPMQGVLDDFAAGRIDEATFLSRAAWDDRWGYDFGLYRQVLAAAVATGAPLLALNAEQELTKRVAREGLDGLTDAERARVPELNLYDPAHRAWWDAIMASMGGAHGHGSGDTAVDDAPMAPTDPHAGVPGAPPLIDQPTQPDPIYTVQVIWDETMADGAAAWLKADPARQVVILAGTGHCHDSAIVGRLQRRGITPALSIRPVIDAEGAVADALVERSNDLLWVMTPPAE